MEFRANAARIDTIRRGSAHQRKVFRNRRTRLAPGNAGDADRYGLKWVFVRDHYYDALMSFAGWRPVDYLDDKTITVWSKDGVPPAQPVNAPQMPPRWQGLMWGTLPFGSSILAILVLLIPEKKRRTGRRRDPRYADPSHQRLAERSLAS